MTNPDPLVQHYYSLNPSEFGFLGLLELRQSVQPEEWLGFTLVLRLRSPTTSERKYLRLEFSRVQDLRIGPLEGLLRYFFEIRPIRDRQLEDINYQVVESEYNAFSFVCSSFIATLEGE
jgi:hypothetical protein